MVFIIKISFRKKLTHSDAEKSKAGGLLRTLHTARIKAALESPQVTQFPYANNMEVNDCESKRVFNNSSDFDQIENKGQNVTERKKNRLFLPINLFNVEQKNSSPDIQVKTKKKVKKLSSSSESDSVKLPNQKNDNDIDELERIYNKYLSVDFEHNNLPKSVSKSKSNTTVESPKIDTNENSSSRTCDVNLKKLEDRIKKPDKEIVAPKIKKKTFKLVNETDKDTKSTDQKFSFLASLSASVEIDLCDNSARLFRENYKAYKEELAQKLFKLFNENIFEGNIPGDTQLEWNDRMRKTAGMCYCKKITRRTGNVERNARIVFATKIVDSAARLRDTLVHEMCHAATWIVNEISDGHGSFWKSW